MTLDTLPALDRRTALLSAFTAPKGFGDQTLRERRADAIELLGGIPDPAALPARELAEATARVLSQPGLPALQYSRTEGIPALREWIAARERVPVSRIVLTNGGFHGLALAIQTTVERGDLVAVDNRSSRCSCGASSCRLGARFRCGWVRTASTSRS
ncbi:hypothetical protein MRBLWH7_003715 [Microbacterium sp. LWH7-1.2]|uniref:hypothetical protein n=1 Tax=Microbacterium sp. LWH7-1.2 TaxID=3135257 RepID=UPI003139E96F